MIARIKERLRKRSSEERSKTQSIFFGISKESKRPIYLPSEARTMHTQVIGTTNAGKTASVILPWLVQDIAAGRGAIVIDGKADKTFTETLKAHVAASKREKDFVFFSLATPRESLSFNPFCQGTPEQISERAIAAFGFENEYYKNVQFQALRAVLSLIQRKKRVPTPFLIRELIRDKELLLSWSEGLGDKALLRELLSLVEEREDKRLEKYSGLLTALMHFSSGELANVFNSTTPAIDIKSLILEGKICYFQLPTMLFPFLGEATGKLILQTLQSTVSEIQVTGQRPSKLFSIYLDDFNDYIYPGFASILNKSRSANIGVVFSHQSLGDLEKVGPDFRQVVLTNTNLKIIMRSNDPDTAEHFAKMIGTRTGEAFTRRRSKFLFKKFETGEESVRAVEEFTYHPNVFKTGLGTGEAICILPHAKGSSVFRVRFSMAPTPKLKQETYAATTEMKEKEKIDLEAQLQI